MIKKLHLILILIIFITIFYYSFTNIANNSANNNIQNNKEFIIDGLDGPYQVSRIVDGDTIVAFINNKKEKVRLIGINTPETVDKRKPVECFGKKAKEYLNELLNNKVIYLKNDITQTNRDKYNRLLRYVITTDGVNINEKMIADGYAYEYTYKDKYELHSSFKSAQNEAKIKEIGLWDPQTDCSKFTNINDDNKPNRLNNVNNSECICSKNIYNCSDFKTQSEAQILFNCCYDKTKRDVHFIDMDNDKIACEKLLKNK